MFSFKSYTTLSANFFLIHVYAANFVMIRLNGIINMLCVFVIHKFLAVDLHVRN